MMTMVIKKVVSDFLRLCYIISEVLNNSKIIIVDIMKEKDAV